MKNLQIFTKKEFLEIWKETPEPRQCCIDTNNVAKIWSGDQDRFGDMPGRSFGKEHCIHWLPED